MFIIPAFALLGAAVDRLWGAPRMKLAAKVLAAAMILAATLLGGWGGFWIAAVAVAGRSLDFWEGVATGQNLPGLLLRSAVPVLVLVPFDPLAAASLLPGAAVSILLAVWYGDRVASGRFRPSDNTLVELARGAVYGAGVGGYLYLVA